MSAAVSAAMCAILDIVVVLHANWQRMAAMTLGHLFQFEFGQPVGEFVQIFVGAAGVTG